jgi:hypothetical protein
MKYADLLYVKKKICRSFLTHRMLLLFLSFLKRNSGRNVDILKFESDLLSALSSSDEENQVASFYTNGRSNNRATQRHDGTVENK